MQVTIDINEQYLVGAVLIIEDYIKKVKELTPEGIDAVNKAKIFRDKALEAILDADKDKLPF